MSEKDKEEWGLDVLFSVVRFVFELVKVTVNALRARNGAVDDLRRLFREPELVDKVFDLIVGKPTTKPQAVSPSWWSEFLAALIQSCGFSWADPNINGENFPLGGMSVAQVEVVSIRDRLTALGQDWFSTDEVLAYLDELGFRPATLLELLFWHLQNRASTLFVVALGSVWARRDGSECSPCLGDWRGGRGLDLNGRDGVWPGPCVFAAVRK